MLAFDWICLALLAASTLLGAWRGLIYEALSVAAWIVAFLLARVGAPWVGSVLPMGQLADSLRVAAGFILLFIVFAFLGGLLASLARRVVRSVGVRAVDRTFGMVFGFIRGILLLLLLAFVVQMLGQGGSDWWRDSVSGPWLQTTLIQLAPLLPARLGAVLAG